MAPDNLERSGVTSPIILIRRYDPFGAEVLFLGANTEASGIDRSKNASRNNAIHRARQGPSDIKGGEPSFAARAIGLAHNNGS